MGYDRPTPDETSLQTFTSQPPDVYALCRKVLSHWQTRRKPWPQMMDRQLERAARWWVDEMQEPYEDTYERPRLVGLAGQSQGQRWISPYVDRVVNNLRLFLGLPAERQRIVLAAWEDGIWWRGEVEDVWQRDSKVWLFMLVIGETELANQMRPEDYRFEAMRWMKSMRVGELPYDKRRKLSEGSKA